MANRTCSIEGCESPHFGHGYCNLHYYRIIRRPKRALRMDRCAWCGERKPINEMRHPEASRGPTPSTCHACREAHPDQAWCDHHGEPHERDRFTPRPERPIGVGNICTLAESEKASLRRDKPPIKCAACSRLQKSWEFRGGRVKSRTCRTCEDANDGRRWCLDCADWLPVGRFTSTGLNGAYLASRCVPCRTAHAHGTTVAALLEMQGVSEPECAACGSRDFLKIDHDHDHCPTGNGCGECVRGYLCHSCNTSEGLLETAERARLLADYMERISNRSASSTP